jgi:uncharacterized protein YrrD
MEANKVSHDQHGMCAGSSTNGPDPSLTVANTLMGNDVYNTANEKLGDIKELMIDMASGQVAYTVLAHGGYLGMADKLFAVPWKALALDTKIIASL